MFVKICGITNEEDALLAVALGADAVGFIFAPSPRWVPVGKVYDITRRLPPEILTVGVFRDEHPKRVIETVDRAGLKGAQLHGHESPEDVAEVMKSVRTVIKAVTAGTVDAAHADRFPTDLVLVDELNDESASGRIVDRRDDAEREGEHVDDADVQQVDEVSEGESHRLEGEEALRDEYDSASIDPVGEGPGPGSEHQQRPELQGGEHSDRRGRSGESVDDDRERGVLDPRPDLRDEQASEEEARVSVPE